MIARGRDVDGLKSWGTRVRRVGSEDDGSRSRERQALLNCVKSGLRHASLPSSGTSVQIPYESRTAVLRPEDDRSRVPPLKNARLSRDWNPGPLLESAPVPMISIRWSTSGETTPGREYRRGSMKHWMERAISPMTARPHRARAAR